MKIKQEHFELLKAWLAVVDSEENRTRYRRGDFPSAAAVKDLDKRYRWDLLYGAVGSHWVCDTLYPYLNDNHIDTALKAIVKPL